MSGLGHIKVQEEQERKMVNHLGSKQTRDTSTSAQQTKFPEFSKDLDSQWCPSFGS